MLDLPSIEALVSRMYDDLAAYARRPGANTAYISRKNEEIDLLADFVEETKEMDNYYQFIYGYEMKIIIGWLVDELKDAKRMIEVIKSMRENREYNSANTLILSPDEILQAHYKALDAAERIQQHLREFENMLNDFPLEFDPNDVEILKIKPGRHPEKISA